MVDTLDALNVSASEISEIDPAILNTLRDYSRLTRYSAEERHEYGRIQQELGESALPAITKLVSDGELYPFTGICLVRGIEAEDEKIYEAAKEICFYPPTYTDRDGSTVSDSLDTMCAVASGREEFVEDSNRLRELLVSSSVGESRRNSTIEAINHLSEDFTNRQIDQRGFLETDRNRDRDRYLQLTGSGNLPPNSPYLNSEDLPLEIPDVYFEFDDDDSDSLIGRSTLRQLGFQSDRTTPTREKIEVLRKLEGITQETVLNILRKTQEGHSDESSVNRRALDDSLKEAKELALTFYSVISDTPLPDDLKETEDAFVEAVKTELGKIPNDVDPRIIHSQLFALHAMIFNGGLENLYRKYRISRIENGESTPESPEEEIKVKSDLALEFLQSVEKKNEELKYSEISTGELSVGIEIEYGNFFEAEALNIDVYRNIANEFEKLIEDASSAKERELFREVLQKDLDAIHRRINIYERLTGEGDLKKAEELFSNWEPGVSVFASINLLTKKREALDADEVVTNPSFSWKTQLRELAYSAKMGGLRTEWGVHETFGGITLSPEHTEIMNALPIAIAADFIDYPEITESGKLKIERGTAPVVEIMDKISVIYGEFIDFPFHKLRSLSEIEKVGNTYFSQAVELRSAPIFREGNFPKLVRQVSFHYFYAQAVKSLQKDEPVRSEYDLKMIEAYTELMTEWQGLLESKGLKLPPESEKFIEGSSSLIRTKGVLGYTVFLSKVKLLSQEDKEFSRSVRRMVRKYNRRAKEVLGLTRAKESAV